MKGTFFVTIFPVVFVGFRRDRFLFFAALVFVGLNLVYLAEASLSQDATPSLAIPGISTGRKPYPAHWGQPPQIQTRDLRPLPGGYGRGSGTLARWIRDHLDRDEARELAIAGKLKRQNDGDGSIEIAGDRKLWHRITLTCQGPFAHEMDQTPNPFTDCRLEVEFVHADGEKVLVPGYFAADGNASESSAESGTCWRVHFVPHRIGTWSYQVRFHTGSGVALEGGGEPWQPLDGQSGELKIIPSDKQGRDLRAHGRLQYVGERYLVFAGSGKRFLKFGADAPETLLGYADFDGTVAMKPDKVPLKTWQPHVRDWQAEDPSWQSGKGRGLIGAINYLSDKGCNAFSFLTYNAGGDGDNVWPFVSRDTKLHYDCSKLDQWQIVFDHGTQRGMYLHFKMQETENDDQRRGKNSRAVPEALDGGTLGPERMLYCRELVARFGHALALNWNLGEENTQSTDEQLAMMRYLARIDPYGSPLVLHTYPEQQEKVYRPLLGDRSPLAGLSLQNSSIADTHVQTCYWVEQSAKSGRPLIVAFDESGNAEHGQCPDLGYRGFDGTDRTGKYAYTQHEVRRQTLWGTLMAGGAGCEYYFGYQFAENDLVCEDWRSRDQSWDYGRLAIQFFDKQNLPFHEMSQHDELIGNPDHGNSRYCFAKPDEVYLVYLPTGEGSQIDLTQAAGEYSVRWFNPREGGDLVEGNVSKVEAGDLVSFGNPPELNQQDWLAILTRLR